MLFDIGSYMDFSIIFLILSAAFTVYNLWLQIKQSRVKDVNDKQLEVLKTIRDEIIEQRVSREVKK